MESLTPLKVNKPIRLIELFAGIGSQAKALKRLGADFEHYRVCDNDKYAIKSYNAIHGTDFTTSDITKLTAEELGIVDTDKYMYLLTYSFPCQDLSLAGKGNGMAKGSGTRSGLLWEVERLLTECNELPQILLMENVTQVHGKKNKEHFEEWIAFLESKGYRNYWQDLNAKNFGIPQNRNRTFMVSVLGDYTYEFPKEFPLTLRLKDMLEDCVDEKFYLKNQTILPVINSDVCKTIRAGGKGSIDRHSWDLVIDPFVCASRGRNPENPSDRTAGIPTVQRLEPNFSGCTNTLTTVQKDNYVAEPVIIEDFYKNRDERVYKDVAPTLRSERTGLKVSSPYSIRKLTPKECWRLMGFNDVDFEKAAAVNSNTQLYKQAGNSIVVDVLCHILGEML